jgi:hypothetical protein
MNAQPRKWTADVTVGGHAVPVEYTNDTLRETIAAAKLAARDAIMRDELGTDASLVVFKQLRSDAAPTCDRSLYGFRDWNRNGDCFVAWQ